MDLKDIRQRLDKCTSFGTFRLSEEQVKHLAELSRPGTKFHESA